MLKEGKAYVLPLLLGILILGAFHMGLASYFLQAETVFSTLPPLQRHVQNIELPPQPQPLTAMDPNPFFATLTEEQEDLALPPANTSLRLVGIITREEKLFALIEYAGEQKLYSLGDQLGTYRLQAIYQHQVILDNQGAELCLAMEKRP